MFGSLYAKLIHGSWEHKGMYKTNYLVLPTSGLELPKFTWVGMHPDHSDELILASGNSASIPMGFLTQGVSLEGHTSLQAYKDRMIGKQDLPVSKGQAVSVRCLRVGSVWEAEGISDSPVPGNLVDNDAITALAVGDPISVFNGCVVADQGKFSLGYLRRKDLTPYAVGKKRFEFAYEGISLRS